MDSRARHAEIDHVQFGILSPDVIKAQSVAEITSVEYLSRVPGGLSDARMGTVDPSERCATCMGGYEDCPGHFGHIKLALPVFHCDFLPVVLKVLHCVCYHCSQLRRPRKPTHQPIWDSWRRLPPARRFRLRSDACLAETAGTECAPGYGCGRAQPVKIAKDLSTLCIVATFADGAVEHLDAAACMAKLSKITDDNCDILGFPPAYARPEWMIVTMLPVPPPALRPPIAMDDFGDGERAQDDLTFMLGEIVKANAVLLRKLDNYKINASAGAASAVKNAQANLEYHIYSYWRNEGIGVFHMPVARHRSGRPLHSLSARLPGKGGVIRMRIMGKRVDFSARSVITPDPCIALDEIGVPPSVAATLTVPEVVSPLNIDRLAAMCKSEGVRYILQSSTGRRIDIHFARRSGKLPVLAPGDIVERHLRDGDIVLFNRQPSLHRMSMMGHRVRVLPWSSFRLNLAVTAPYNADMDGDEMNVHAPQDLGAAVELRELASVTQNLISPRTNQPCMGLIQDALLGIYKLTQRDVFLERADFMQILFAANDRVAAVPPPAVCKPRELWTGCQVVSALLPESLDYRENGVVVSEGALLEAGGGLTKRHVGAFVHVLARRSNALAVAFIDAAQRAVNAWLLHESHSAGLVDCVVDAAAKDAIRESISSALRSPTASESEAAINARLNAARDAAGQCAVRAMGPTNAFQRMAEAGSKGSAVNIAQIVALVGQQNVEGRRPVARGFRDRTLPHFVRHDRGAAAHGFVKHSFIDGLDPVEFWFHAMAGREGITDTAIKTAIVGYIQRRLVKSMESLVAHYDGSVRACDGVLVQFLYGDDGYDACALEFVQHEFDVSALTDDTERAVATARPRHARFTSPFNLSRLVQAAARRRFENIINIDERELINNFAAELPPLLAAYVKSTLRNARLNAAAVAWIIDEARLACVRARVQAGEAVGVTAAESVGEPTMQLTLNTFHLAGVSKVNVTLGLPRAQELINATAEPATPAMRVYVQPGGSAAAVARALEYTTLDSVVLEMSVSYCVPPVHGDKSVVWSYGVSPWVLKLVLRADSDIAEVAAAIRADFGDELAAVAFNHREIDIRLKVFENKKLDNKKPENDKDKDTCDGDIDAAFMRALGVRLLDTVRLHGIEGISRAVVTSSLTKLQYVETEGSRLRETLAVAGVDARKTISNDVIEVYSVLGIEAARTVLLQELHRVFDTYGVYINERHLLLLADSMTQSGAVVPNTRAGMSNATAAAESVIAQASFERPLATLEAAATHGTRDPLCDVSGNIAMGNLARVGTGTVELFLDNEALAHARPQVVELPPVPVPVHVCAPAHRVSRPARPKRGGVVSDNYVPTRPPAEACVPVRLRPIAPRPEPLAANVVERIPVVPLPKLPQHLANYVPTAAPQ